MEFSFQLQEDEIRFKIYLLMRLTHAILQLPSENSKLCSFLTSWNATFPTEKLVFMDKTRSSYANSFNSPNLMIFYPIYNTLNSILVLIFHNTPTTDLLLFKKIFMTLMFSTWKESLKSAFLISLLTQELKMKKICALTLMLLMSFLNIPSTSRRAQLDY